MNSGVFVTEEKIGWLHSVREAKEAAFDDGDPFVPLMQLRRHGETFAAVGLPTDTEEGRLKVIANMGRMLAADELWVALDARITKESDYNPEIPVEMQGYGCMMVLFATPAAVTECVMVYSINDEGKTFWRGIGFDRADDGPYPRSLLTGCRSPIDLDEVVDGAVKLFAMEREEAQFAFYAEVLAGLPTELEPVGAQVILMPKTEKARQRVKERLERSGMFTEIEEDDE